MTVTTPQGFRAAGVAGGLKASGGRDVALVVNDGPSRTAAAVLTGNRVQAAPVLWTRQAVSDGAARAVVLNSGGANACTGPEGFADTHRTAEHVAGVLSAAAATPEDEVGAGDVLVCSTGLIGVRLDMPALLGGIDAAAAGLAADGGTDAAHAIMTTDTVAKTAVAVREGWSVGGMAKGAGMLAPALATMLSVVTTDAVVDPATADAALRAATRSTFDRVDSDGCQSTNDTVILLASGASGVEVTAQALTEAVTAVCADLSRQLVGDAEGAGHDIAVSVLNATTEEAAVAVARAVTRSNLVKTAIFGNDPNWGRIVAAVGTVPEDVAPYDPLTLDVTVNGVQVCRAQGVGEPRELVDLAADREVHVEIDLHAGDATATVWTNDLTHDYVHENSAYSS
ncbi:bifunctional glutamate N-acetyltransferase/amino-acid acetyltransferase ArgJ [Isoptericola sp. 178]|uniref:bifunctional glutamate N-acetyltransferase/amino-acid acetyltransferase ArgJ n=1 Tax=Isoptericola sp. 178 TaxID=3064651 RepID=UPI002713E47D|nr:bifunctional glutamate N-acetyltransferase/amino-acid acetyltransferase ArgJ [Isoptericola sp. 178]MDO8144714.1 bifunctional glutamate N-acetyltransferase/amino-acid acetyltransferase ArgJ [Isoptericola sp. 178]